MVTILLEKILSVLEGWSASFASFIIDLMTKLDLIEDETANLPDIKTNTDNISSNTDSMTATLTNIKTDTGSISGKVNNIDSNTTIIKNNINTISTNVGTASAFCEDTANNTLEIVDKITTIASDTTQLRTNSNSITSDVHDIKDALQYYFLNTFVTEDSEGSICNFDTDLKEYLQEAKVDIPADVNGISGIDIIQTGINILNPTYFDNQPTYYVVNNDGSITVVTVDGRGWVNLNAIPMKKGTYTISKTIQKGVIQIRTSLDNYASNLVNTSLLKTTFILTDDCDIKIKLDTGTDDYPITDTFQLEYGSDNSDFKPYIENSNTITFTTPITDGAEVDLLSGIVKINTTPVTYDSITPIAIRTFKGVNNIYSDIGDMSVTYRETLKHYIEKQNS